MPFRNSILAGLTLIREAIRSQNYSPGVAGWSIDADGSAEFADLSIRSSDGSGAVVEIANGVITLTAPSGWKIILDPTLSLPVIYFLDNLDDVMGAINATGTTGQAEIIMSSGPFTDGPVTDWRWFLSLGEKAGGFNAAHICRNRDSDPSANLGGELYLDQDSATLGMFDSTDATVATQLYLEEALFLLDQGRLRVAPRPTSDPALFVNVVAAGQTGNLLHLQREGSGKFAVDIDGHASALGPVETFDSFLASGNDIGRGTCGWISTTSSTATTTSASDSLALTMSSRTYLANRAYKIHIKAFVSSTVAADEVGMRVRKTNTAGTTVLDIEATGTVHKANQNYWVEASAVLAVGGSDVTAALVLTYFRRAGTGNARLVASGTNPIYFEITDVGEAADFPGALAFP